MRLIDADALLKGKDDHQIISTHLIWNAPTVDAVEVVRCYECVQSEPCLKRNSVYCNKIHDVVMRDWFCADGERKEDGDC